MNILKTYFEDDKCGKYKVNEQSNGVKVRILIEPSKWYIEKTQKRKENEKDKWIEVQKKIESERLIKDKMRELAIRELKKEGKL